MDRLKTVEPRVKTHLKTGGDSARSTAVTFSQAKLAARQGDFALATAMLDEVEEALQEGQAAPTATDAGAAFKNRLAKVKARYETLKASDPGLARPIAGLMMQAGSLAQIDDYEGAALRLDEAEKHFGGIRPAATAEPAVTAEPPAEFKTRLDALRARYDAIKDRPESAAAKDALTAAVKAGAAGKYSAALDALDTLEARLTSAKRAIDAAGEVEKGGLSRVALARCSGQYKDARFLARAELARLQTAILKDTATRADSRFEQIARVVDGLPKLLDGLDNRLLVELDKAAKAVSADDRAETARAARAIVKEYRAALDQKPETKKLDSQTGYGKFDIYGSLVKSLDGLSQKLDV
jgi:hypothetical protein